MYPFRAQAYQRLDVMMAASPWEKYFENLMNSRADYRTERDFYIYDSAHTRSVAPGTIEGVRELNRWYNEGLFSADFALDTNEVRFKLDIAAGKNFSFTTDFLSPIDTGFAYNLLEAVPTAQLIITDSFVNADGVAFKNAYDINGQMIMVPINSESRSDAAVLFLDWMVKPENMLRIIHGVEGEHYEMQDGIPVPLFTVEHVYNTEYRRFLDAGGKAVLEARAEACDKGVYKR